MRFDLTDMDITARNVEELGNALGDLHNRLKAIMEATDPAHVEAEGKTPNDPINVIHMWDLHLDGGAERKRREYKTQVGMRHDV